MSWRKERFGTTPDGTEVYKYIVTNAAGVSAAFTDLGGIWLEMIVPDREGIFADVLLGWGDVDGILNKGGAHLGEIVGRNANRIGGAAFELNGIRYELEANDGENNLHSGPDFYRNRIWQTRVEENPEQGETQISFSLFSPDGDQHYPGNAEITVSYTLTDDNAVRIHYHMVSDADTVANFTNHAYFNLAGHNSGTVLNHRVWIDADTWTIADQNSIPTGELVPVKGTPMDFTVPKPIGREIGADYAPLNDAGGYDHNWVLNHKPGEIALSLKAWEDASGRLMEVYTDLPGVQFYTGNFLEALTSKDGVTEYGPRAGFCMETQYFPDAVNKPQFPGPFLRAGETYDTTTIYKFLIAERKCARP